MSNEVQMSAEGHGNGAIGATNAPTDESGHQEVAAAATIFFGDGDAGIALIGQLLPEPAGEIITTLKLFVMWSDLITCKGERAFVGQLVLFGEFKIHFV